MSSNPTLDNTGTVREQLKTLMTWVRDFRTSRLLTTAVEENILERFSESGSSVDEVLRDGENADAVYRFCRTLASVGLLDRTAPETYRPSDLTTTFLLEGSEFDLRPIIQLFHRNYEIWNKLPEILTEGHQVESSVFGDVEFGRDFMLAMETRAHFVKDSVAETVTSLLSGGERIIDLGSGTGVFTRAILEEMPDAEAVLADLPHVVEIAEDFSSGTSLSERLSYRELDFFETESYGEDFDVACLFSICHMFGEDKNRILLNRAADTLRPGGRIILRDYVLENGGVGPPEGNLFDLHMILATDTGRNYTLEEYETFLQDAGFEAVERMVMDGEDDLLTAKKPS
ncbi:MAG: methyltransferase [bacterium]